MLGDVVFIGNGIHIGDMEHSVADGVVEEVAPISIHLGLATPDLAFLDVLQDLLFCFGVDCSVGIRFWIMAINIFRMRFVFIFGDFEQDDTRFVFETTVGRRAETTADGGVDGSTEGECGGGK